MENPMNGDMMQAMSVLQSENGIAKMMMKPVYATGPDETQPITSQAELVADLFNIERLDTKKMADAVGVELSIQRMTPETAAVLLQAMVRQESLELIEKFNELEEQREQILAELLDEDELQAHREMKEKMAYSVADDEEVDRDGARETPDEADVPEVEVPVDPEDEADGESGSDADGGEDDESESES